MKSVKKILCLLMILALSVFGLVACGKTYEVNFYVNEEIVKTITTDGSQKIELPDDPVVAGYDFGGWYIDKDSWQQAFNEDTAVTASINVYAKLTKTEPKKSTLIEGFDLIDEVYVGQVENGVKTIDMKDHVTVDSRSTWKITGATSTDKVVKLVVGDNDFSVVVNGFDGRNETYDFSIRRKAVYSLTFKKSGGVVEGELPKTITEGGFITEPVITKTGYNFLGWFVDDELFDFEQAINANTTFVAKFEAIVTTVTFKASGWAGVDGHTDEITYGEKYSLPKNAPDGYKFGGWYNGDAAVATSGTWTSVEEELVLTAKLETIEYNIGYTLNGGVVPAANPTKYKVTDNDITLYNPALEGYEFLGWTGTGLDAITKEVVIEKGSTGNRSYTANFSVKTNSLTFNKNAEDATGTMPDMEIKYNQVAYLSVNAFVRTGYTFIGWALTADGELKYADRAKYTMGADDGELFALWKINEYVIEYDLDGGHITTQNVDKYTVETATFTLNNPVKQGYEFLGWTGSNGNVPQITVTVEKGSTGDKSYVANWEQLFCDVTFYANDGSEDTTVQAIGEWTTEDLDAVSFERDGYEFRGWALTADGAVVYEDGAEINMEDEDIDLYAVWGAIEYSVGYELNGGNVDGINPTTYTIETAKITLINPTKTGYTFVGWTGTDIEEMTDTVVIASGSTGDREYEAHFTRDEVEVSFNANGGSGEMEVLDVFAYDTAELSYNAFAKTGYTFAGWALTADGDVEYADGAEISVTGENIELYAKWAIVRYSVSYDLDGGVNPAANVGRYTVEDEDIVLAAPTKEGYTFVGWTGSNGNTPALSVTIKTSDAEPKNYKANWLQNKHDVIFNANGGAGSMANMTVVENTQANLTANAFTRKGYNFAGWALTADGAVKYADEDAIEVGEENVNLYAKWSAVPYAVSYNLDGGAVSGTNPTSYTIEDTFTLINPTKSGYVFLGWTGTGISGISDEVTVAVGSTGARSYTANWKKNMLNVTFNSNGGTGSMAAQSIQENAAANLEANAFARKGYAFAGWALTAGGTVEYTDCAEFVMGSAGVTLYAKWSTIPYSISYNVNGGVNAETNVESYTVEDEVTIAAATRLGYTFLGWTGSNGNVPATTVTINEGTTGNKSYKANWSRNAHDVIFNANGGAGTMDNQSVYEYQTVALDGNAFTRVGYRFDGWALTADGAVAYADGANITMDVANVNLYAKWTAIEYAIRTDLDGGDVESANPTEYTVATATFTLNNPTKEGYTFLGWTGSNGSVPQTEVTIEKGTIGDKNYKANWSRNSHNVTFNANGGTGTMSAQSIYEFVTENLKTNVLTRKGYDFRGWALTADGAVAYADGAEITMGTADVALYAIWRIETYRLGYNLNGGAVAVANPANYTVETATFTLNNPTKSGYTFLGWTGTGITGSSTEVTVTVGSTGARDYVANWQKLEFTIAYDLSGGAVEGVNPTKYDVESANITLINPTKLGYTFLGWTGSNGNVPQTEVTITTGSTDNRQYVANFEIIEYTIAYYGNGVSTLDNPTVYTVNTPTFTLNNPTDTTFLGWLVAGSSEPVTTVTITQGSTGNKAYTAKYDDSTEYFNVVFNSNGGAGTMANLPVEKNDTVNLTLNSFTRNGYTFQGWATTSTGEVAYADGASFTMGAADVNLYAVWTLVNYNLTCNLDGGTVSPANPVSYTITTATFTLNNPTKDGYTFLGWTGSNGSTPQTTVTIAQGSMGNKAYTANWEAISGGFTVKYYAENGTEATRNFAVEENEAYEVLSAEDIDFTYNGYEFIGWATEKGGSDEYLGGDIIDITEDVNLYAVWSPISYTITYNLNNGSNDSRNVNKYDIEKSVTIYAPTRANYSFAGWTVASAVVSYEVDYEEDGLNVIIKTGNTGRIILTANWASNAVAIKFNANGGTGTMTDQSTVKGATIAIKANTFTPQTGYAFAGWAVTADGAVEYADGANITMGSENVNLYAKWTAVEYSINYNLDGGTVTPANPANYTIESAAIVLNAPEKAGSIFLGWTGSNGTTPQTEVTIAAGSTGNKTYTANWQTNKLSVTFNANGGSGSMAAQGINEGATVNLTANKFTRNGYDFAGWALTADGAVQYADGAEFTMGSVSVEIFAKWSAKEYGISYTLNGGSVDGVNPANYTIESAAIVLIAPTRTGYTFTGWTGSNGSTPQTEVTIATGSTGNKNYTANWTIVNNTISYTLNGGSATNPATYTVEDTIVLANPSKLGYTFTGWTGSNGSTPQTEVTIAAGSTGNKNYTANWTATVYTITYRNVDAYTTLNNPTEYTIETATFTLNNPAVETFLGWTGSNGSDPSKTVTIAQGSTGNKTYTAKFDTSSEVYSITLNANGGTGSMTDFYEGEAGSIVYLDPCGYTKNGYTFQGWATSETGAVAYNDAAQISLESDLELYAVWAARLYNMSYNLEGGTVDGTNPANYTIETETFTLINPTKAGYSFAGWTGTGLSGLTSTVVIAKGSTGNRSYTANWSFSVKSINFNANGGTGTMTAQQVAAGSSANIKANDFTRLGYTFAGWALTADGAVAYADGASIEVGDEDINLFAKWALVEYSINYNLAGGTVDGTNPTVYTVESNNITLINPTKGTSQFSGWTGTGLSGLTSTVVIAKGSTGNRTYTANWADSLASITFNANGGTGSMIEQQASAGSLVALNKNTFTKTGYSFAGWALTASGDVAYADQADFELNEDVELFAKWSIVEYPISYTLNGGTVSGTNPAKYTVATASFTLINPTKTGYTFLGWTGSNGSTPQTTVTIVNMTGALEYTANWSANSLTVTFNNNGGAGTMSAQTIKAGESANLTLNTFTRNGYTFAGWATTASGSVAYTDGAKYTMGNASVELYAKWNIVTYTLSYTLAGGTISGTNPANYTVETATFTLINPTKTGGYEFAGWSGTGISGTSMTVTIAQGSTGNRSYTANWEQFTPKQAAYFGVSPSETNYVRGRMSELKFVLGSEVDSTDFSLYLADNQSSLVLIASSNYTISTDVSGNKVMALKSSYLNTLSVGGHVLKIRENGVHTVGGVNYKYYSDFAIHCYGELTVSVNSTSFKWGQTASVVISFNLGGSSFAGVYFGDALLDAKKYTLVNNNGVGTVTITAANIEMMCNTGANVFSVASMVDTKSVTVTCGA